MNGGPGNYGLNAADGAGGDTLNGGALGHDVCFGDADDIFIGCETQTVVVP